MKITISPIVILLLCTVNAGAEMIYLKSGKVVEGVVVEQTQGTIKVDTGNAVVITYYADEIDKIVKPEAASYTVQGIVKGMNFICGRAEYDSKKNILLLRQGEGVFANPGISIFLVPTNGAPPDGQIYEVNSETPEEDIPRIQLQWLFTGKNVPQLEEIVNGYEMQLSFENRGETTIPGMIKLKLPEKYKTEIEGIFEAVLK